MLIDEVIQTLQAARPPRDPQQTVDLVIAGDAARPATGVAVTFTATVDVLERAARLGANLVITHEPTFYNHLDETEWLANDPVYRAKQALIERHGLVVWRQHDGVHVHRPDDILQGMLRIFGWQVIDPSGPSVCEVAPTTLRNLAAHCRMALQIGPVRIAGDPEMPCSRVGLLPGAWGGRRQIEALMNWGADVVVCGESPEWETCEYVRDARQLGMAKGLVVLGHANSEEAGMQYYAEKVRTTLPAALPVHFLPAGDPFLSV